jgi:hypothetical protein
MMRIKLQWCQVQAGTRKQLLAEPTDAIDYIETCWIISIRDFLQTYGLRIDLTRIEKQKEQAMKDEFLMDAIRERGGCTTTQLQRINACRMFLRVTRLSDIASAGGTHIRNKCFQGQENHLFRSTMRWPRHGRPPKVWRKLWAKTLKHVFNKDGGNTRLRHDLGTWTADVNLKEWRTLCVALEVRIEVYVLRNDGDYDLFRNETPMRGRQYLVNGQPIGRFDSIPLSAVPASLGKHCRDGQRSVTFRK